jgi:uncharacterized protein (DUF2062 family)
MTHEEKRMRLLRRERIARVKRMLRLMPRKATLHKYPVLRWFAKAARKRSYLWCFRVKAVVPAIYVGCILALLPLYGIQLPIAVLLSFWMRANLPIFTSLQFITNPITIVPVYFTAYQVGKAILHPLAVTVPALNMREMKLLIEAVGSGDWVFQFEYLGTVWLVTFLGGSVLGVFLGTIGSISYRMAAYEVTVFNKKFRAIQQKLMDNQSQKRIKDNPSSIRQNP